MVWDDIKDILFSLFLIGFGLYLIIWIGFGLEYDFSFGDTIQETTTYKGDVTNVNIREYGNFGDLVGHSIIIILGLFMFFGGLYNIKDLFNN